MLDAMAPSDDVSWQRPVAEDLRKRLAEPDGDLVVFVVDDPARAGALAACAAGTIERRLGSPGNPSGLSGHLFNVATDPGLRRRGYSRVCVTALLAWCRARGVRQIDLHATEEGEPLYTSLGFARTPAPAMRLTF